MARRGLKTDSWKILLAVNPMARLIGSFRNAALGGPINWGQLALASGCAVLLYAYSESSSLPEAAARRAAVHSPVSPCRL